MSINVLYSKETYEERTMHSKSDNIEVMAFDGVNEVIGELFITSFKISNQFRNNNEKR